MRMLRSWPTKIPNMNKMRQKTSCVHKMCRRTYGQTNMKRATTLIICLLSHFIHIWYLGWPWSEHAHSIPISRMVDFCESYSPYQIWIKYDKRQLTSCVHKMCERIYGQTNTKRATTLAKINHPWNRYTMRMLRSWTTKIPHMSVRTSCVHNLSFVAFYSYLVSWLVMIWACA
jgi:hypothetical protein